MELSITYRVHNPKVAGKGKTKENRASEEEGEEEERIAVEEEERIEGEEERKKKKNAQPALVLSYISSRPHPSQDPYADRHITSGLLHTSLGPHSLHRAGIGKTIFGGFGL